MLEKSSNSGLESPPLSLSVEGDQKGGASPEEETQRTACFHCGTICFGEEFRKHHKSFCCQGCLTVFELLSENGLDEFYSLSDRAGVRIKSAKGSDLYRFLDEPGICEKLAHFSDGKLTRITFEVPQIHCIACVWLLENLFRLQKGIGQSQVNFQRKELAISFDRSSIPLSEVVALLSSVGYEPKLRLSDLESAKKQGPFRKLWLQLGVAGFAFGNNMLFSIAVYFGLDAFTGPGFKTLVGYLSMALALPVVLYSAQDYWKSALVNLRHRMLTMEVPIAAGIAAIFAQSAYEVMSGRGEGYFDSLTGLLFFLLCGKLFQQKTYSRLSFDRDYKSFFPLSVTRKKGGSEKSISLEALQLGDELLIRNGQLIPADSELIAGPALIDYSFVTGESEPVEKEVGALLYAGGRQMGGAIEVRTVKVVSQSYLTSLWNQDVFRKDKLPTLQSLTNSYSQRFTKIVIGIAFAAALYWAFTDSSLAVKAFTSVLIVACPCALALAAPFTLGTAVRVLGRNQVYVKSAEVLESMARVNAIVFDKTGTLTSAGAGSLKFCGETLTPDEERWVYSMTRHSTHPYAVRIGETYEERHYPEEVRSFLETAGCGMEGMVKGREIWIGSAGWLNSRSVNIPEFKSEYSATVHLAINGRYRGTFMLRPDLRAQADTMLKVLAAQYDLSLSSGDTQNDSTRYQTLFGNGSKVHFQQSPTGKLDFIRNLQGHGKTVMMVGDGLNDSGALKQSDVGIAVVESIGAFSPASDVIMQAGMVPMMGSILRLSKGTVRIVRLSFGLSAIYNVIGIAIAASGRLAPIVCAILMPLSSVTVVAFSCLATEWLGIRAGINTKFTFERNDS